MGFHRELGSMEARAIHVADRMMKDEHREGCHQQSDDDGNGSDAGQKFEGGHVAAPSRKLSGSPVIWRTDARPEQSAKQRSTGAMAGLIDVVEVPRWMTRSCGSIS